MKITDDLMEAIMCLPLTLFVVNQDEWYTKEAHAKSMAENALYVQQYGKRHSSGWSNVKQWKNQARSVIAIVELRESEGIRQAVS